MHDPSLSTIGESWPWYWAWLALTVVIGLLALAYRRWVHPRLLAGRSPGLLPLVTVAVFIVVASLKALPAGDEPHFLLMSQSLWQDGDFDLRNNYLERDYVEYHPQRIPDPHVIEEGRHWYPVHSVGLPVAAAPWFAVAGRAGVVAMLALLTVAGLWLLWSVMELAGFGPRARTGGLLAAALTLPLASMAGQIFSEVPAFVLVALGLRAVFVPALAGWDAAGLAIAVGLLPWIHSKFVVLAAALLVAAMITHRRRDAVAPLSAAACVLGASVTGVAVLTRQWFDSWVPGAQVGLPRVPAPESPRSFVDVVTTHFHVTIGYIGVLLDQQSGLLIASPVYLLAIPGLVLLWRRRRSAALACALVAAAVYVPAASWGIWYGGQASPARLLTPLVPVLAVGVASALDAGGVRARWLFTILMIPSVLYAYALVTLPAVTRYADPDTGLNYLIARLDRLTEVDLTFAFASYRDVGSVTWVTTIVYAGAIALVCVLLLRGRPRSLSPELAVDPLARGSRPGEDRADRDDEEVADHEQYQRLG